MDELQPTVVLHKSLAFTWDMAFFLEENQFGALDVYWSGTSGV